MYVYIYSLIYVHFTVSILAQIVADRVIGDPMVCNLFLLLQTYAFWWLFRWSFHCLVLLLLCCYATQSCWCAHMISGHALVASVSISQWWQLSMKLFFRFYSVPFLLACIIYARRDWMPGYRCELVYALWCFSVTFGMLHLYRYQLGIWYFTSTVHNYSFVFQ